MNNKFTWGDCNYKIAFKYSTPYSVLVVLVHNNIVILLQLHW
uniref:Uncharacterized protein n=1 Tax=Arundo donax TaxID=35708 RepID=A0A0A9BYF0_ARUDO